MTLTFIKKIREEVDESVEYRRLRYGIECCISSDCNSRGATPTQFLPPLYHDPVAPSTSLAEMYRRARPRALLNIPDDTKGLKEGCPNYWTLAKKIT